MDQDTAAEVLLLLDEMFEPFINEPEAMKIQGEMEDDLVFSSMLGEGGDEGDQGPD